MTITVDYTYDNKSHMAQTLQPEDLGFHEESEWTITGTIVEDYFEWVNGFEATHPVYGALVGDYEDQITAESQEAHDHFVTHHPMYVWDYYDI